MAPRVFRRWWFWTAIGLIAFAVLAIVGFIAAVPLSSDTLRRRMIATLSERLDSHVELGDLQLRVFPGLRAGGKDLVIRRRGRTDAVRQCTRPADALLPRPAQRVLRGL